MMGLEWTDPSDDQRPPARQALAQWADRTEQQLCVDQLAMLDELADLERDGLGDTSHAAILRVRMELTRIKLALVSAWT